jgi:hypothetical protein
MCNMIDVMSVELGLVEEMEMLGKRKTKGKLERYAEEMGIMWVNEMLTMDCR